MVIWLTGQPGAGKTTISGLFMEMSGRPFVQVDGDDIRSVFDNRDYSEAGRRDNVDLAQKIALFLHLKGQDVIVSLVSPYRDQREYLKSRLGPAMVEVWVHTTNIRGREDFHVAGYEPPVSGFLDLDTTHDTPGESVQKLLSHYEQVIAEVRGGARP
jgi:adenylylsulfate kinase